MVTSQENSAALPLDMAQFNTITEGKSSYQEELLELFFMNSSECLSIMERNCVSNDNDKWQNAAGELKNSAGNIGAMELSKICAIAHKMASAEEADKKKMLASIRLHIQRLRAFVRNTRY